MTGDLHLTIDRLILHGFTPAQRDAVAAGFRGELARLLGQPNAATALGGSRAVAALTVAPRLPGRLGPGEAAARQLLQGLKP